MIVDSVDRQGAMSINKPNSEPYRQLAMTLNNKDS